MTRVGWMLAPLALLGACEKPRRAVSAEVVVDAGSPTLTLNCRAATSGRCYALVIGAVATNGAAAVGETVTIGGVTPGARLCLSDRTIDHARCERRELVVGRQIIRHERIGAD